MLFRKCIYNFSHFSKPWDLSRNAIPSWALQQLTSPYQCKKNCSDSAGKSQKDEIPSTLSRYELFTEKTAHATLDVEEERQKISDEKKYDEFEGINLERGTDGVFAIEELVSLLRKEKGEGIVVIKIPSEFKYVDYMVIVSGRSKRHMLAMSQFVRKVYKMKVNSRGNIPRLEGKNSDAWMALDLGNIVLHVFSKPTRDLYDLETLWTVGKEYDPLTQKKSSLDVDLADYKKILASLSPQNVTS